MLFPLFGYDITQFNWFFQSASPNLHLLKDELDMLMRKFLSNFVNPEAITFCSDVTEIDITDQENLLHIDEMFIGHQTRIFINTNDDILPSDLDIFILHRIS